MKDCIGKLAKRTSSLWLTTSSRKERRWKTAPSSRTLRKEFNPHSGLQLFKRRWINPQRKGILQSERILFSTKDSQSQSKSSIQRCFSCSKKLMRWRTALSSPRLTGNHRNWFQEKTIQIRTSSMKDFTEKVKTKKDTNKTSNYWRTRLKLVDAHFNHR